MTTFCVRAATVAALFATLVFAGSASAQTTGERSGGFLDNLFGGNRASHENNSDRVAQMSDSDLVLRLDRLESSVRQLTGAIEQLQYHNQQLEQAMRKLQGGSGYSVPQSGERDDPRRPMTQQQPGRLQPAPAAEPAPLPEPGRRSDIFDPSQHPNAPGAPRPLGSLTIAGTEPGAPAAPPIGIVGGREPGAPLDLSTVAQPAAPLPAAEPAGMTPEPNEAGGLPPPPPRNPSATGAMAAVQPPTQSPRDEYDLAYGYMLHKDYALAETAFQNFLKRYPDDRRAAEATYWLGESMFQRQRYRDAAESFLTVTTKHEKSSKAPEALFRLGQSLAALGETEAACAALGEVGRKYPRAPAGVKQGVGREQKRVRC